MQCAPGGAAPPGRAPGSGGAAPGRTDAAPGGAGATAGRGGAAPGGGNATPGGGGTEDSAAWPEGMDPLSSYLLEIKLLGNPENGRKDVSCFCIDKVVDSDTTNLKDFVESITEKYPPSYKEIPHTQYYDADLRTFPLVSIDQEFMSMFEKHSMTKVVHMFIAYIDISKPYQPITEWEGYVHPSNTQSEEENYLQNPLPENEHVGVDEEAIYLGNEPVVALDLVICCEKEKELSDDGTEDGQDDDEAEEDEVDDEVEEDEVGEANNVPDIEYDKDDPAMTVGSTYPNMAVFKVALSQHAIKREFEFNILKSAPYRFTAHCANKSKYKCPWRLHASTMEDMSTVMVKTYESAYTCSSTRRKKRVKNATKYWICEKVKDWLIEDSCLGAKALQKKLKEHHKPQLVGGKMRGTRAVPTRKGKKGQHKCPICEDFGHHWPNCKRGNPEDIAAVMEQRGPPKKKRKTTKASTKESIVPWNDEAPQSSMSFPPSQSVEPPSKQKEEGSGGSKKQAQQKVKRKENKQDIEKVKKPIVLFDSPAMGTRSKKVDPCSPGMSTRSRRRLSL